MFDRSIRNVQDVVDWGLCVGCGACAYVSKGTVQMAHIEAEGFRPTFDDRHVGASDSGLLEVCPGAHVDATLAVDTLPLRTRADHEFGPTLEIWEGWASDPEIRLKGSSGGLLSALSLYCIERGTFAGVIHAGMDPATPWMNRNFISRDRADVLARTGSRYAPSAPVAALSEIGEGTHVFIGKPCDASAVSELQRRDSHVGGRVGLVLTFFCAGTPSTRGTLDLMKGLAPGPDPVRQVHYRGDGWPGDFRVIGESGTEKQRMSYAKSWGQLTSYRPLRCNLCPDGLGRVSDIACGDAWDRYKNDGDPGRSLVLVRTERGRRVLQEARGAGYLTLRPVESENVLRAQADLLQRRRELYGRLAAFRFFGVPTPAYHGFSLLRSWLRIGLEAQAKSVFGTARRILKHGWFRRRRPPESVSRTVRP